MQAERQWGRLLRRLHGGHRTYARVTGPPCTSSMLRYRCGEKPHQNHQLQVTGIPRGGNRTTLQPHTNINTLIGRPAPSPPRAAETQRTAGPGPRALSGMLLSQHRPQQQIIRLDGTQVSIATTQELPIAGRHSYPAPGIEPPLPAVGAADDTIVLYRRYTTPGTQNIQLAPAPPKQPQGPLHAQSNPPLAPAQQVMQEPLFRPRLSALAQTHDPAELNLPRLSQ